MIHRRVSSVGRAARALDWGLVRSHRFSGGWNVGAHQERDDQDQGRHGEHDPEAGPEAGLCLVTEFLQFAVRMVRWSGFMSGIEELVGHHVRQVEERRRPEEEDHRADRGERTARRRRICWTP